jgi:DNA-binding MarR family transcriptional regulator
MLRPRSRAPVQELLPYRLRHRGFGRAAKILARKFDERLGEGGVSFPRSRVLVEVTRLGPIRVTDVAAAVGIAQGTASTLLEALVRDGLVARSEDPTDRRATRIIATPKGVQQAQSWLQAYQSAADELFSPLPRSRWPELLDIMTILAGHE